MTEKKFSIIIISIFVICCVTGAILGFVLWNVEEISDEELEIEKNTLYELVETTPKDIESLIGNENVSIDISSNDKIILTFKEKNSKLSITYTTEYEVIEEEFVCTQDAIFNNFLAIIAGLFIGAIAAIFICWLVIEIIFCVETKICAKKSKVKQKKKEKQRKKEIIVEVHQG